MSKEKKKYFDCDDWYESMPMKKKLEGGERGRNEIVNKPFCIFHHQNSQSIFHRSVKIKSKENKNFASMVKRRIRIFIRGRRKRKKKWEKREKSLEEFFSIFQVRKGKRWKKKKKICWSCIKAKKKMKLKKNFK